MMTRFIGGDYRDVFFAIGRFLEDFLLLIASSDERAKGKGAVVFDARFSSHDLMIASLYSIEINNSPRSNPKSTPRKSTTR